MKSPSSSALTLTLPRVAGSRLRAVGAGDRSNSRKATPGAITGSARPAGAIDRIPIDRAGLADEVLRMLDKTGVPIIGADVELQIVVRTKRGYSLKRRAFALKD